jgi:hypothetical protein
VAVVVFCVVCAATAVELWRLRGVYETGQSRGTWASLGPTSTAAVAADFVENEKLRGPILNDMELGGYLIFRLFPAHRVFIDSRQLDADLVERYIALMTRRDAWRAAERDYGFRTVVLSNLANPSPLALRAFLLDDPAWHLAHVDTQAAVFVREPRTITRPVEALTPPPILPRSPGPWGTVVSRLLLRQDPSELAVQLLASLGDLGLLAELDRQASRLLIDTPGQPDYLRLRGTARLFLHDPQGALGDLTTACRRRPTDLDTCYLRARSLHETGRDVEAARELDRILAIDGTHRSALQLRQLLESSGG